MSDTLWAADVKRLFEALRELNLEMAEMTLEELAESLLRGAGSLDRSAKNRAGNMTEVVMILLHLGLLKLKEPISE